MTVSTDLQAQIKKLVSKRDLSAGEITDALDAILAAAVPDTAVAAFLVALTMKGETPEELRSILLSLRKHATKITPEVNGPLIDTCGTGGDRIGTFNISTVSAFIAAGAGCHVAKHGNRSVSSNCGSADLLDEMGIKIDITPELMGKCIDEVGIGFLFAPILHKAMKYAIGPRREIGVRTIFNILGPLTNPANAKRQVLGIFKKDLMGLRNFSGATLSV